MAARFVLARLPEYVKLGRDLSATYVHVADNPVGSMPATAAAVIPVRIVCAKIGW